MTPAELGTRARQRRRALGLTQVTLADLAGCSPVFVHTLEKGKPGMRLDKVLDVMQALGLEIQLLVRGAEGD